MTETNGGISGFVLRLTPSLWRRNRWVRHKATFVGDEFATYNEQTGHQIDCLPVRDIAQARSLVLVPTFSTIMPVDARVGAPGHETTDTGLLLTLSAGQELVICLVTANERDIWLNAILASQTRALAVGPHSLVPRPKRCHMVVDNSEPPITSNKAGPSVPDNGVPNSTEEVTPLMIKDKGNDRLQPHASTSLSLPSQQHNGALESVNVRTDEGDEFLGSTSEANLLEASQPVKAVGKIAKADFRGKNKGCKGPPLPPAGGAKGKGSNAASTSSGKGHTGAMDATGKVEKQTTRALECRQSKGRFTQSISEKPLVAGDIQVTAFLPRDAEDVAARPVDFGTFAAAADSTIAPSRLREKTLRQPALRLLDDALALRIGIATIRRIDLQSLAAVVDLMDTESPLLAAPLLEHTELLNSHLQSASGTQEPLDLIRNFIANRGDPDQLRDVEKSLVPLALVPRAAQRLNVLVFASLAQDRIGTAATSLACFLGTAQAMQQSRCLGDAVHLFQEFIAWDVGLTVDKAAAPVFHIGEQLEKSDKIRPPLDKRPFPGYSLLHWMVEQMLKWGDGLHPDPLGVELPELQVAAKMSPDLIRADLQQVLSAHQLAQAELTKHRTAYRAVVAVEVHAGRQRKVGGSASAKELLAQPNCTFVAIDAADPMVGRVAARVLSDRSTATLSASERLQPHAHEDSVGERSDSVEVVPNVTATTCGIEGSVGKVIQEFVLDDNEACDLEVLYPAPFQTSSPANPTRAPWRCKVQRLVLYAPWTFTQALASVGSPTGLLWVLRPGPLGRRPTWFRCRADVRRSHLVLRYLYPEAAANCESAVALPTAEIVPFPSLHASKVAKWLASLKVYGFEIQTTPCEPPVVACVENPEQVQFWVRSLAMAAEQPGVGPLLALKPEQQLWCCLEDCRLHCFANALDYALGKSPRHIIDLESATVRSFRDQGGGLSEEARRHAITRPFGFEIEVLEAGNQGQLVSRCWLFTTASPADSDRWLRVLITASRRLKLGVGSAADSMDSIEDDIEQPDSDGGRLSSAFRNLTTAFRETQASFGMVFCKPSADESGSAESENGVDKNSNQEEPVDQIQIRTEAPLPEVHPPSRRSLAPAPQVKALVSVNDDLVDNLLEGAFLGPPRASASRLSLVGSGESSTATSVVPWVDTGDPADEPLRKLVGLEQRLGAAEDELRNDLLIAEETAAKILEHFDERAGRGGSHLATLSVLLGQLAVFATKLKAALKDVRDFRARKERQIRMIAARVGRPLMIT